MTDHKYTASISIKVSDDGETLTVVFPEFDDDPIDYYKTARDSYLSKRLKDYPDTDTLDFSLEFSISSSAKNGVIVHAILDTLPNDTYTLDKNHVRINPSNDQLGSCLQAIADILSVIKGWKSTVILCNGEKFDYTGFYYLLNYYEEKNHIKRRIQGAPPQELKKKYITKRRPRKSNISPVANPVRISRGDPQQALNDVIQRYVELYAENKDVQYKSVPSDGASGVVVIIENSLITYFWLMPKYWAALDDETREDWKYPYIMMQELTHNELFKFNFAGFKRNFEFDYIGLDCIRFHGPDAYSWDFDKLKYIDAKCPELELMKRFEQYPGDTNHFIILRMEDVDGKIHYGIGTTTQKVHSFVLKLCDELETKNSQALDANGASCLWYRENHEFITAFLSWKGKKKRWRLENKFSYFYEDQLIKDYSHLIDAVYSTLEKAKAGEYEHAEFGSYTKPLNRWKSEELVYNITKKLYKDHQVIYQYSPYYLSTDKGCMTYDIYICGLKIAIEYQGKQHFEPVDYFGGKEHFEQQQMRDKLKAERSRENGVKLIYINYWEDITPSLIKERVESVL